MFVLSHTPNTWGLIQSLLQCVLAPAGDLLPLFTLTGGAGRAAPPVPVLVQAAGCSPSAGQVSTAPSPLWSSIHRQVFAHSLGAEPAPATSPGCPHVPVLRLPFHLPLCETSGRRWTPNRFFLPFSLSRPCESGCREASSRVTVLDGDDDHVQLENSFAALSAEQDCEISGLSSCLSLKLLVAVCSGAELCLRGEAEVGAELESLALSCPSSFRQDLLVLVFPSLWQCLQWI